MKNSKKKLSVSIDPDVDKILKDNDFNKSKLINKLLKKHIEKNKKK